MPRKSNPEKDIVITSASAGAARTRRTVSEPRAKRTAMPSADAVKKVHEPEMEMRVTTFIAERELSHDEIARVAYSLWEARGCQGGNPEDDWRQAEEQLRRL